MKSRTQRYYDKNPEAKAKKDAYNTQFNKKPAQRKKRSQLVKARRDRGIYGKGGPDLHHSKSGKLVPMEKSKNRGYSEKSRLKGYRVKKKK